MEIPLYHKREGYAVGKVQFSDFDNDFQVRCTKLTLGLGRQARPKLGASIANAADQVRKHPGIPASGAYVGRVRRGTPAERAGLRKGDVITALGGQPVKGAEDVHRLVPEMPKGRDVSLTYVRGGQERDTLVRL